MESNNAILIILDGWGHGLNPAVSAIAQANTPYIDSLYQKYPNSELTTHGSQVGLPDGQMGNSEVGHLNIGAGRVVFQELARINNAITDGSFYKNETIVEALEYARVNGKKVHLMGLLSDGGVHSHINHLKALCDVTQDHQLKQVYIHAFMDGRDTAPTAGIDYLEDLNKHIKNSTVEIASIIGRYYAMDRDKRWERIKLAYDLLVNGVGTPCSNIKDAMQSSYDADITDEFIKPMSCVNENGDAIAKIEDGDVLICFNFRTDRPREISEVLTQKDFPDFDMKKLDLHYVTMTRYDESFKNVHVVYSKEDINQTLGEVLSTANKTQVRIAETEKYPHVTFFFSGGREDVFEGERRLMVASPKVATYDLQPEMSAYQINDTIIEDIQKHQPNFICLNYANADMVGHTGDFKAAIQAAETVDKCLQQLMEIALEHNYTAIIIADHGNSDFMINEDGTPHTAHTTNLVPCFLLGNNVNGKQLTDGKLADVAPTILEIMNIDQPKDMTGKSLITKA